MTRQFSDEFRRACPDVTSWYRSHYLANRPQNYIDIMEDLATIDLCEQLEAIQCPTLIVTGEHDISPVRGTAPLESVRMLQNLIPGARLSVIRGARHYPHIDHPESFNDTVMSFLKEVS